MRWFERLERNIGISIVWMVCIVFVTVGCTKEESEVMNELSDDEKTVQIGMIFDSFVIERWQRDRDAFVAKATQELGATVNIQDSNGNVEEQVALIEYFIDKKVDVIVIVAIDSEYVTNAVKKAKKEGIKVIAYDRLIKNADVDLYISFDNEKVGSYMAQTIMEKIPEDGSIFMMCGPLEDNNVSLVESGFMKVIDKTDAQVVRQEHAAGWIAESGFEMVSEYLSKYESVDAIMCGNDGIAGQVIHALSERRLAGDVIVVGQDADLDACQRIVEGTQTMTVYKQVENLAQIAAEYAYKLGTDEAFEVSNTYYDGTYAVPYVGLEPIAITKDNMHIIIEDGFHLEEDVYLNVAREVE